MAVTDFEQLEARWASGQHVGAARPTQFALIRTGKFTRGYHQWDGDDVGATIYGEDKHRPWQATWEPTSEWVELPNVLSVEETQDYDSNGIAVATMQVENIAMTQQAGPMGDLYHLVERGFLSPWRGLPGPTAKAPTPVNDWYGKLVKNAQIKLWQGYGDATEPTFTGLIDDCDLTSRPDRITLTVRDFGKVLTDEQVFGWCKSAQLREPVIFEATGAGYKGQGQGFGAAASSERDGYPATFVTDTNGKSAWISGDHSTDANTEWVEVRLPAGRYESFAIHPAYAGMEVFVGIDAHAHSNGAPALMDGDPLPIGMVDTGAGTVPGVHGGWPYIRHYDSMSDRAAVHQLPASFELGDNSVLRVGFRRLRKITPGVYRASVERLAGIKQAIDTKVNPTGKPQKTIQVDDLADMVKVVLRWAGFKEWNVENVGTSLTGQWTFNRANTLRDIIAKAEEATGFVFYMTPPTNDDDSIGVPTFRQNLAVKDPPPDMPVLRDTDLLTGVQVHATDEPLSWPIRVRGKDTKRYGVVISGDSTRRVMARYDPPWAAPDGRMAKIIKHRSGAYHVEPRLRHTVACLLMAQLIALKEAVAAASASVEIPGNPHFWLNDQVALVDTGTGLNTRLYVAQRQSTFQAGEQASWKTVLGGALIDTPEVQGVIADMKATLTENGLPADKLIIADPAVANGLNGA